MSVSVRQSRRQGSRRAVSQLRLFGPQNDEIAHGGQADADADADASVVHRHGGGGTAFSKTGPAAAAAAARCRFRPGEHTIAILNPARMTSLVYTGHGRFIHCRLRVSRI